ncbi:hypothetical protein HY947_06680 [Candidatus Gottesmanbacteria bacterium]|nr:hypothetical protein [Candidatus Gottesmanbacteria bacterium]
MNRLGRSIGLFFVGILISLFAFQSKSYAWCTPAWPGPSCTWPLTAICSGSISWCCSQTSECPRETFPGGTSRNALICDFTDDKKAACQSCMAGGNNIWTAAGCLPATPEKFAEKFLGIAVGLAGGIAFLMILFGGFQMMTSAGNPEQLNAGKELIGSSIAGLLLVVFSVFILQFIGVNILGIPGFG